MASRTHALISSSIVGWAAVIDTPMLRMRKNVHPVLRSDDNCSNREQADVRQSESSRGIYSAASDFLTKAGADWRPVEPRHQGGAGGEAEVKALPILRWPRSLNLALAGALCCKGL
jgi:hypothetical protein